MRKQELTQNRLKALLNYNKETGEFSWRVGGRGGVKKGAIAGHLKKTGYVYIRVDSERYLAHRLAFLYVKGYFPETCKEKDDELSHLKAAVRQVIDNVDFDKREVHSFAALRVLQNSIGYLRDKNTITYRKL